MDSYGRWGFSAGQRRTIFKRTIVAIDREAPPRDHHRWPLRYPMKTRDEADIRQESGAITGAASKISVSTAVTGCRMGEREATPSASVTPRTAGHGASRAGWNCRRR